jgi:YegS/Rv2252/BmrU family lipid kinase
MSDLPLIVVNPTSAANSTAARWPALASEVRRHFGPFECRFTTRGGDARSIARSEAGSGRKLIVACGGDGTISEIAAGIMEAGDTEAELGILPSGTGGDFRRTLKIPTDGAEAALVLKNGRTKLIDAGRVTYEGEEGSPPRYFVIVVSCGMAGEVVRRVKENQDGGLGGNARRLFGGRGAFAVAALQTTLTFGGVDVWLRVDGQDERRLRVANLSVANARYIGGGMMMAPNAKLDDGLFDVVIVGDLSARKIFANAHRLYLGTHLGVEQVFHLRARRLSVRPVAKEDKIAAEVDGELAGMLPVTIDLVPRALRVRCP